MNQESVLSQFEMLLPLAAAWATEQEQKIVPNGVPLSEKEIGDARAIGVQSPDRVRLLQVEAIPRPSQPQLKATCDAIDFLTLFQARPNIRQPLLCQRDWIDITLNQPARSG